MKLPPTIGRHALEWLTAKLNGNGKRAAEIMPELLEKDLLTWDGSRFEVQGTRPELLQIEPSLLERIELERRMRAGDIAARNLLIDHDLLMERHRATCTVNHRRLTREDIRQQLDIEAQELGLAK